MALPGLELWTLTNGSLGHQAGSDPRVVEAMTTVKDGGQALGPSEAIGAAVNDDEVAFRNNAQRRLNGEGTRMRASAPPSPQKLLPIGSLPQEAPDSKPAKLLRGQDTTVASGQDAEAMGQVHRSEGSSSPAPSAQSDTQHVARNTRRAATSSPLPSELLSEVRKAESADVSAGKSALNTEILPAPPSLPYDPSYPPLDPAALHLFAPHLHNPLGGAVAKPRPSLPLVPGSDWAVTQVPPPTSAPSSGPNDRKKVKQPVYTLGKPKGYEGKVPYALYAIVHGLPEAEPKAKGARKRKAGRMSGSGAGTKEAG